MFKSFQEPTSHIHATMLPKIQALTTFAIFGLYLGKVQNWLANSEMAFPGTSGAMLKVHSTAEDIMLTKTQQHATSALVILKQIGGKIFKNDPIQK